MNDLGFSIFPQGKRNSRLETGMDSNEKWYTVKQFARSFGQNQFTGRPDVVGVDTVQRWIKRGFLKAFEFPRNSNKRRRVYITRLISEAERQRFVRERMTS
jgi:hypothetical protein